MSPGAPLLGRDNWRRSTILDGAGGGGGACLTRAVFNTWRRVCFSRRAVVTLVAVAGFSAPAWAGYHRGDFNLDGIVDALDEAIWAANLGRTSAVPRPDTILTPALRVAPDRRTVLSGETVELTASGGTGLVHWTFVKNPAGGSLSTTTGVSATYTAGATNASVDVIQAWDNDNLLSRTFMNVISSNEVASLGKAIIVAGGRSMDDPVWLATDYIADKAFNVLRYRGFSRDNIQYLSFDPDQDADGNGQLDDIDLDSSFANAQATFTGWVGNANQLLVYLADHGSDAAGEGFFRLNGSEVLSSTNVNNWLNDLQNTYGMDVTVIMDFCYAGSFLNNLATYTGTPKRILIAAASSNELTYFIAGGAVSFSDLFWSGILQGQDLASAYALAADGMSSFQSSVLEDGGEASNRFVGATFVAGKDFPVIGTVLGPQSLTEGTTATLWADDIESYYPLERVWCTVIPPSHSPNTNTGIPVLDIPVIDLAYDSALGRYQSSFDGFAEQGLYLINYYAQDIWGSVSPPKPSSINQAGIDERLLLVAAGTTNDARWESWNLIARNIYQTFRARQIAPDRIQCLSAVTNQDFSGDGTNDVWAAPTLASFAQAITNWATNASVLTVYLVGGETNGAVCLNDTETLSAAALDARLDAFQTSNQVVNLILEFPGAGSFIPVVTPPAGRERISIASTGEGKTNLLASGGLISFSSHFMSQVVTGQRVGDAFRAARGSIRLASGGLRQGAGMDDNGDGVANQKSVDGLLAVQRYFGAAFVTGEDIPSIGSAIPDTDITGTNSVVLWLKDVLDVNGISNVWVALTTPSYAGGDLWETNLTFNVLNDRYEARVDDLEEGGTYVATFTVENTKGARSSPVQTLLYSLDPYEVDDTAAQASFLDVGSTQPGHNFHVSNDVDWIRFYVVTGQNYTVEVAQQGENVDVLLDLYYEQPDGTPVAVYLDEDETGPGDLGESLPLDFLTDTNLVEGFYLLRVSLSPDFPEAWGADSDYDVSIFVGVGGGDLIVIAVDKLNPTSSPPGAVAILNNTSNKAFSGKTSVVFDDVAAGIHTVRVEVAAGYVMESDPAQPDQQGNPTNTLYGNPKRKLVVDDSWQTVTFQFFPYVEATGLARDEWTGEYVEGAKIAFLARSGVISNIVYDGIPNSAAYKTQWFSRVDGAFPTNVVLPAVAYDLNLTRSGYVTTLVSNAILAPTAGLQTNLGLLYMTPLDTNSNGIADAWEANHFAGTNAPPGDDADDDGMSNAAEYRTGTDPTNPASFFRSQEAVGLGTGLRMTWPVAPGRIYRVNAGSDLVAGDWPVAAGPWTAAVGQTTMSYTNPLTGTGLYFRAEALTP